MTNFNDALLQAAKTSKLSGQRAIEMLEETSQLSPADFTQELAQNFAYPVITLAQMLTLMKPFLCLPMFSTKACHRGLRSA
jgi:hypothetical protein